MTIQTFLEDKLNTRKHYDLTIKDERTFKQNKVQFILDRITSGKFRKSKLDDTTYRNLQVKVQDAVSKNLPLQFTFPFGGYKLFSLPTAPYVDWAEFFTISYYSDYLNQVSEYYEPGVVFTFSSDEVIISKMDNIPQVDVDKYTESFKKLVEIFNEKNPKNLRFQFVRVRDLYSSPNEVWKEIEGYMTETKNNWVNFDEAKKDSRKKMILLNYNLQDTLDDAALEKLLAENTALHDAYLKLTKRRDFVRGENKIVTFSLPISDAITLGTTKYSSAKFWTGLGVIKIDGNGNLCDVVLTPSQLLGTEFIPHAVNLLDMPNFSSINTFEQH